MTDSPMNKSDIDSSVINVLGVPFQVLPTKRYKLLVVDDQPINIQVLYQAFSADYDVCMATSGEQALKVCVEQKPDLILLDIEMPGMNGFEVCLHLKGDAETRSVPVIFVTAHADEASETQGLEVGAVDFIYKPINPNIVRARVKTHITLKEQADLLRDWAYIDGLTNIHNRRYFDERLNPEWGRATRNNTELSVLLIDVDYFKRYNDYYGHQAGDECLRKVAGAIRSVIERPVDVVARYGGEEFVCLLPDTNMGGALYLAEAIKQTIMALNIAHAASAVLPCVTVSLGVCVKTQNYQGSSDALLRMADIQLYNAKEQGRNCVCSAVL
jgi:diguanylate cyclase (GGDEF)-like protein